MNRGKFVVLEGIDGSGKTTLAKAVFDALSFSSKEPQFFGIKHTREPTLDFWGKKARSVSGFEQLVCMMQDRKYHEIEIRKSLNENCLVLCDRYWPSTYVYQGTTLGAEVVEASLGLVEPIPMDLLVYLDCPAELAFERTKQKRDSNYANAAFENLEFLQKAWKRYEDLLVAYPGKNLQLAAEFSVEKNTQAVIEAIERL